MLPLLLEEDSWLNFRLRNGALDVWSEGSMVRYHGKL